MDNIVGELIVFIIGITLYVISLTQHGAISFIQSGLAGALILLSAQSLHKRRKNRRR